MYIFVLFINKINKNISHNFDKILELTLLYNYSLH